MGVYKPSDSGRTTLQSIWHYFHEFGGESCHSRQKSSFLLISLAVPGAIILMAAFCLFLLPFSLQTYGRAPYDSATFITMVVLGFLMFFVFAAWEKWFARVHFIRYDLLRERTVMGCCLLALVLYMAFYGWVCIHHLAQCMQLLIWSCRISTTTASSSSTTPSPSPSPAT